MLFDALFSRRDPYRPSPTVEHRLDKSPFDTEQLQDVLEFIIHAIREERFRLELAHTYGTDDEWYEPQVELVWPEAA